MKQKKTGFLTKVSLYSKMFYKKITDIVSLCRPLLNFCILTKAILFGGIKRFNEKRNYLYGHILPYRPEPQEISEEKRKAEENRIFKNNIKFSVLVPLYNTPKDFLEQMLDSVSAQTYKNFELCLADGSDTGFEYIEEICQSLAKTDNRIKYKKLSENKGISENTNECINMSTGDYICLFDHDDLLHPCALFEYAKAIEETNADFLYCDEDKFNERGKFFEPYYKPDFAVDNLRANNYICHFTVFKKSLLERTGMFRKEFDGSQDHDLILRLTEKAEKIYHIPKILYRWRVSENSVALNPNSKGYSSDAGIKAVKEHLKRVGLKGDVGRSPVHPNYYRLKYDIDGSPLVSVIIPNKDHIEELSRCIDSILQKTTYKNYEIIIVENESNEETFKYYESLKQYKNIRIAVFTPDKKGFNYSAINNFGVKFALGEHILFLNNDTEVITPCWIEEMLMYSSRNDIGAVGAMLYYPDNTVQHAGVILGIGGVAGHAFKYFPRNYTGSFGRTVIQQNYSAVTAACLMMKKSIFDNIGGFDEAFKVAFNDIDLCMRIRKLGYLIAFTPCCELYHHESISRGTEDTKEKQERFKNEVLRFEERWGEELKKGDPYYNPNLTLTREDFGYR